MSAGVFHIAISGDGRLGIAAELRPKNLIPLAHVEHGWVFGNSLAVFGADAGNAVTQMPLDELERYFSLPFGVAIAPDKKFIWISSSTGDEVAVVDTAKLLKMVRSPKRANVCERSLGFGQLCSGAHSGGPQSEGYRAFARWRRLYVAKRLDDAISVIDTAQRGP